jgi:dTDP-4-amino-4,6-dideoxygalactose transaminase
MAGGINSRMDELQAAVLRAKLPASGWLNRRRRGHRGALRGGRSGIRTSYAASAGAASDVVHLYVVRTRQRESLRARLAAAGVATDIHYPVPDHRQPGASRRQRGFRAPSGHAPRC